MQLVFGEDFFDQKDYLGGAASFLSESYHRWFSQPLDRYQGVKVSIKRNDDTTVRRCLRQDFVVLSSLHPELANVVAGLAQLAK